jgi:hypothetical protein
MTERKSIANRTSDTPFKFKKNETEKLPLFYEEITSYYGIG